jgi:hypothetical protein
LHFLVLLWSIFFSWGRYQIFFVVFDHFVDSRAVLQGVKKVLYGRRVLEIDLDSVIELLFDPA